MIKAILAVDKNFLLGCENKMAWNIPSERDFFISQVKNKDVLMGKNTYLSIPNGLGYANNFIYSKTLKTIDNGTIVDDLDLFLEKYKYACCDLWVIGGNQLINKIIDKIDLFFLTIIDDDFNGDIYLNKELLNNFEIFEKKTIDNENEPKYDILLLVRK